MNGISGKWMKAILCFSVLFVFSGSIMVAQEGDRPEPPQGERRGPGQMFDRNLQFLVDSIQINAEQQEKVKVINETYQSKMDSMMQDMRNSDNRDAMREKFGTVMEEYQTKVGAVLTEEQKAKYDKAMADRKSRRPQREGRPEGPPPDGERRQRGQR